MNPMTETAQIQTLLAQYFDGLFFSDTQRLQAVLHPAALYATVSEGQLRTFAMADYWPFVAARPSPASKGEPRRDHILSVEVLGPTTAVARVNCAIAPYFYQDILSLIKEDGRWWIIAKVFQMQTTDQA